MAIFAVNPRAVGAFQIGEDQFFLVFLDFDVEAADPFVVELNRIAFLATYCDRRIQVSKDLAAIRTV